MSKHTIVLYHKNCTDGFGAAYAAWCKLQDDALYIAVQYGDDLIEVIGAAVKECEDEYSFSDLYLVDFSCSPEDLIDFSRMYSMITIIDHHETAVRKLQDSNCVAECEESYNVDLILDMEKSGAVLTWEYFFPEWEVPFELMMIQDRDLWKFEIPESKAFTTALYALPFDFKVWEEMFSIYNIMQISNDNLSIFNDLAEDTKIIVEQGKVLLKDQENKVRTLEKHAHNMVIEGYSVPCVNANHFFASDLGNNLSTYHPFAASFTISLEKSQVFFSLRSSKSNKYFVNVAEIAEKFGGGGHKHAAGFAVPLNQAAFDWLSGQVGLRSEDFKI